MIIIKNKVAISKMQQAGFLLSGILRDVQSLIKPGVSTLEIDTWIAQQLKAKELTSACKGYMGYKYVSCISVNDEVVHGVPDQKKLLKDGDLVKVDVCASYRGYCADLARCYFVGVSVDKEHERLVAVTKGALDKGIAMARPGNRLGDISAAIQAEIESHGFGIVRDFAGHGIGKHMHEAPEILNYGTAGKGPLIRAGMAFAIEPMVTLGNYKVYVTEDGWTVKTKDKSFAAHVEDTVVVTENEPLILTRSAS